MKKNINGIEIAYSDSGKIAGLEIENGAKTIFFLHGWGACKENFNETINLLKVKYRCIAIDLPGFGESGKLIKSFTVDDYTDIVIKFIEEILNVENVENKQEKNEETNIDNNIEKNAKNNIENNIDNHGNFPKIILVGHSFGGRIMIKLNNRKNLPFIIEKNIFIDAAGIKHEASAARKFKTTIFKGVKSIISLIPGSEEVKEKRLNDLRSRFGSSDYKNAEPIMRETLVKTVNEDLKPLLSGIKAESLLIWGDKDTATPIEDAKIFESSIKGSGLVVLKGCGHFSFVEDRYTYLRVIEAFLLKN